MFNSPALQLNITVLLRLLMMSLRLNNGVIINKLVSAVRSKSVRMMEHMVTLTQGSSSNDSLPTGQACGRTPIMYLKISTKYRHLESHESHIKMDAWVNKLPALCLQAQGTRWSRQWGCWSSTESSLNTSSSSASSPRLMVITPQTVHRNRSSVSGHFCLPPQLTNRLPIPSLCHPFASSSTYSWYHKVWKDFNQ